MIVSQQLLLAGGVASGSGPILDGVSGITGAWSMARDLLSAFAGTPRYTNVSGFVSVLADQSGSARDFSGGVGARPAVATAGPNSAVCADFDGTNDYLNTGTVDLSSFGSNSTIWMMCSVLPDTITPNNANAYDNAPVIGESGGYLGLFLKNTAGTPETAQALNYPDVAESAVITPGTFYVLRLWHTGGNLFLCVNMGTPVSLASGNTGAMTGILGLGHAYAGSSNYLDGKIGEVVMASAIPPSNGDAIAADFMAQCGAV